MPYTTIKNIEYYYNLYNPTCTKTIVLVHGHPFDGSIWDYQLAALNEYKIIVPHLRGYGKTPCKQTLIFTDEHAIDLAYLLDELHIDEAIFVGLSMGGQIIAEFARLFYHRVNGLVLVGNLPFAETDESALQKKQLAAWVLENGIENYTNQNIHLFLNRNVEPIKNEVFTHLEFMMSNNSSIGAAANLKGRTYRRDNATFIQQFAKPLQFIAAEYDHFCSKENIQAFAATCVQQNVCIISNAGHVCNMEQPEQFNDCLKSFLKTLD